MAVKKEKPLNLEEEKILLEQRKVKALEKISNSLDALTIWFEEIDKDGWSERIEYYLYEWFKTVKTPEQMEELQTPKQKDITDN